jgi:uncharacterized protein YqgC (DUF456 family)
MAAFDFTGVANSLQKGGLAAGVVAAVIAALPLVGVTVPPAAAAILTPLVGLLIAHYVNDSQADMAKQLGVDALALAQFVQSMKIEKTYPNDPKENPTPNNLNKDADPKPQA